MNDGVLFLLPILIIGWIALDSLPREDNDPADLWRERGAEGHQSHQPGGPMPAAIVTTTTEVMPAPRPVQLVFTDTDESGMPSDIGAAIRRELAWNEYIEHQSPFASLRRDWATWEADLRLDR